MIEINLLPEEMRKKESPFAKLDLSSLSVQKLPIVPIAAGFVILLFLIQVALISLNIYYKLTLTSLTQKYENILPKKKEAEALKAKNDLIMKRVAAIDELMGKRFSWARKLSALSESMTPGIWLNELDYDGKPVSGSGKDKAAGMGGRIVMSGYAAGAGEQGAALVGKFIKSLKDSREFYSDLSDIALVAVKSDKADGQEVMSFKINCVFK